MLEFYLLICTLNLRVLHEESQQSSSEVASRNLSRLHRSFEVEELPRHQSPDAGSLRLVSLSVSVTRDILAADRFLASSSPRFGAI